MKKLITALLIWPFFIAGAIANFIWNGLAFGWFCVDREMHPDAWKIWDQLRELKSK